MEPKIMFGMVAMNQISKDISMKIYADDVKTKT